MSAARLEFASSFTDFYCSTTIDPPLDILESSISGAVVVGILGAATGGGTGAAAGGGFVTALAFGRVGKGALAGGLAFLAGI